MQKNEKVIFHIDLNQFFATCAIIKAPYLKRRVFVVGGPDGSTRGVISTASYRARKYGIRSGMNVSDAFELYPKLLVVPVDFPFYNEKSSEFYSYFTNFTDLIYKASIDEVYIDVTELCEDTPPLVLAKKFQDDLLNKYELPCSIGISHTLFLAKTASDMKKPLGITHIRKQDLESKIHTLPIKDMFGIGVKTYPKLNSIGINTIGDILKPELEKQILKVVSRKYYRNLINEATGYSDDIVDPSKNEQYQSISQETTFSYPIVEVDTILETLMDLTNKVIRRLNKHNLLTKGVGIKFRDENFKIKTRSTLINDYTNDENIIKSNVEILFNEHYNNESIRLVGAFTYQIIKKEEYEKTIDLFNYQENT